MAGAPLVPARPTKKLKLEDASQDVCQALVERADAGSQPFSSPERDALIRAVEACAAALWQDAEALPCAAVGARSSWGRDPLADAAPAGDAPEFCRMALRLAVSAGALRRVPSACVARACSWLSARDLGSLVSLSCWRLDAEPGGLGALTVALGVRRSAEAAHAGAWVPSVARPPLAPLAALREARDYLGDGSRAVAALDALRRDCGRPRRSARDALATFKRALFGRRGAPGARGAEADGGGGDRSLGVLLALCGAVAGDGSGAARNRDADAASDASGGGDGAPARVAGDDQGARRVQALDALARRFVGDREDEPGGSGAAVAALLDAGLPEALSRVVARPRDDGGAACVAVAELASFLVEESWPCERGERRRDRLLRAATDALDGLVFTAATAGVGANRTLVSAAQRAKKARALATLCDASEPLLTSDDGARFRVAVAATLAREPETLEALADAAKEGRLVDRLARLLALVATNPDAREALARQPRVLGLVERLARHEAAAGPPRDSLCETAASLARAAVLAASRVTARRGGDAEPESPDSESDRGVCDAYAPDSDGSDPGPKPTLRRPSAHWKVCEKLAF